jgi:tetratricopeptide (TPR) repeat protein
MRLTSSLVLILVIVASLFGTVITASATGVNENGAIAEKQIDAGDYLEAIVAIDKVLELEPSNIRLLKLKLESLINLESYKEAAGVNDKIFAYDPKYEKEYHRMRAGILNKLNQKEEALKAIDKAISATQADYLNYHFKAQVLAEQRRYLEALEVYNELLKGEVIIGKYPEYIFNGKAQILEKLGKSTEAIEVYNQAIVMNPLQNTDSQMKKIKLLRNLGNKTEADKLFKELIAIFDQMIGLDLKEDKKEFLERKIDLLMDYEKFREAIEVSDQAIGLRPRSRANLSKARALERLGRYREAIEVYDKYLKLDPSSSEAYIGKIKLLATTGKRAEAFNESTIFIENNRNGAIKCFMKANNLNELREASEKGSSKGTLKNERIKCLDLVRAAKFKDALECFNQNQFN